MKRLDNLILSGFPKLIVFPKEICSLRSLRRLRVGEVSDSIDLVSFHEHLNHLFEKNCSLDVVKIYGKEQWDSVPDHIQYLTGLTELSLFEFGIEVLPEWIGDLSYLEWLYIYNCKKIKHLPSEKAMRRLIRLDTLAILGCPLLAERCRKKQSTGLGNEDSEWHKISHIQHVSVDGQQLSRNCKYYAYIFSSSGQSNADVYFSIRCQRNATSINYLG